MVTEMLLTRQVRTGAFDMLGMTVTERIVGVEGEEGGESAHWVRISEHFFMCEEGEDSTETMSRLTSEVGK